MPLSPLTMRVDGLMSTAASSSAGLKNEGDARPREGKVSFLGCPPLVSPSPFSLNYLFNPLHPDARRLKILHCRWLKYDKAPRSESQNNRMI